MANEFRAANNTEVLLYKLLQKLTTGISTTPAPPGADYTTIGDGRKVVAVAGTAEAIAASTAVKSVTIQAELLNAGVISVGTTTVDADEPTRTGIALESGDTITIDVDDLSKVWIDAENSGEGVTFIYFN